MTDYVRELQSLELALKSAEEQGTRETVRAVRGQIPGAVATCRRELARLEANPRTLGSGDYAEDINQVDRLREVLVKYGDHGLQAQTDPADGQGEEDGGQEESTPPADGDGQGEKDGGQEESGSAPEPGPGPQETAQESKPRRTAATRKAGS